MWLGILTLPPLVGARRILCPTYGWLALVSGVGVCSELGYFANEIISLLLIQMLPLIIE